MKEIIKEVLLKNNILPKEKIDNVILRMENGENIEEILRAEANISFDSIKHILVNNLYFEENDILDILVLFIKEEKKEDFYKIVSNNKISYDEKLQDLLLGQIITEEDILKSKAKYYNIEFRKVDNINFEDSIIESMSKFDIEFIRKNEFIVLELSEEKVIIGRAKLDNNLILEEMKDKFDREVLEVLISKDDFENLYNLYLNKINLTGGLAYKLEENTDEDKEGNIEELKNEDNPIVKFVNTLISDSLRKGASDIHIEPYKEGLRIKNRIDGVLVEESKNVLKSYKNMVISRIKILSNLNIAEHRIPQDGRFKKVLQGREVDFRVSILPTAYGESAVMRILDKKSGDISLDTLGLNEKEKDILETNGNKPHGIILVTGPTGSGKTTTLYALLRSIKKKEEKFITIEDPIEYEIDDIVQIPVNEKAGLTFAKGLRSILRQDPDKIMVGEIRDKETAEIAVQAALTGHLVFTTIHANSTVEVIGRLINIGVDPYQFSTALNIIVSQRLMRRVCPDCMGSGCIKCDETGYKGRLGVFELLEFDEELKEMIIKNASPIKIREKAIEKGMTEISERAKENVENRKTTKYEFTRVIGKWEGEV